MSVNQEFDSFLDRLRPYIIDYLQEKGIDTTKNFCCLNPEHDDGNPSMTAQQIEKYGYRAFCFSCSAILDIFDVYAILENKPRNGPGYMKEVILPLANKYGIKPPVVELSQKEQFCYDLYKIYGEVASMLDHGIEEMNDKPRDYILEKEWSEETLESLEIGIISFAQIEKRFGRDLIEKFGLNRPDVFDENNVVFAIKDEKGRVIRFFARITGGESRWQSTSSSKLLYDVWANHGRLYLSHLLDRKLNYAILVEGQPDAITLTQNGFKNVVATCGTTAFSEAHSTRLAFLALTETIIIYDNDNAGKVAVKKLLQQDFVKKSGAKYSIVNLIDAKDPDEYVRQFGVNRLQHLIDMRLSSFRYMLAQFSPDDNIEEVAKEVLPYIACNKSDIARESMVRDLAKYLKDEISVSSILSDVKKLDDEVKNETNKRQKLVVHAAYKEANENPEQAIGILREATDRLQDIEKESGVGGNLESSTISRIQVCKQWEEKERSEMPTSFKLLPGRMDNIQRTFSSSNWASGQLIYIGAVENMGKSSFINDMAWQIACNKENRARVFMHTIDDSAEDLIRRMVCQAYGSPYLTINMVANPQIFYEEEGIDNVYEMREEAYARFMEVASDGRIFIKDASDGTTISFAESQIRDIRRKYPDENLVYFLDNFHNVTDWPMLDQRNKFTKVSKELQRMATIYKCTVVSTVEYRKNDPTKIGTNEDLAESRSMKFDAKLIMHIFSDLHAVGSENAELIHKHEGQILPRTVVRVGKNKVGNFKGDLFFDFYPSSGLFMSVNSMKAKNDLEARKAELKGLKDEDEEEDKKQFYKKKDSFSI